MCDICQGEGYVMQDIGTATTPDWVQVPCRCNRPPTDEDYLALHPWHDTRAGYPGETPYPEFPVPVVDYDPVLPSGLLA